MKDYPTSDFLHSILEYDSQSGLLFWKERSVDMFKSTRAFNAWNSKYSGKEAGTISKVKHSNTLKYYHISINNKLYRAHIIIWIMHNNIINGIIDHVDGNGLNNRIDNLRDITQSKNIRKCKMRKNNTSGIRGVCLTESGKYSVSIMLNRKKINLGRYENVSVAAKIYATAAYILSGENYTETEYFQISTDEYKLVKNKLDKFLHTTIHKEN